MEIEKETRGKKMTEETLEKLEEKRAEGRLSFYGVHGGGKKGKFRMDIYRPDGRRKGVKTKSVRYFVPKTKEEREWAMAHVRELSEKARKKDEIRK